MNWPLWVPDKMDVPRSMPIILPYLATQTAVSSFVVPKGYRFDPHAEFCAECEEYRETLRAEQG